jgi:Family of unknown function (DUF6107)
MADWTHSLADWSLRGAGALAGSSASLIYMIPKQRREAASRLAVGLVFGLIFGPAAGEKLAALLALDVALDRIEITLMGSSAASFASWWALGLFVRLLNRTGLSETPDSGKKPDPAVEAGEMEKRP